MKKLLSKIIVGIFVVLLISNQVLAAEEIKFSDVFENDPLNRDGILNELVSEEIIQGYPDQTFRPLNLVNRAEFTKMVISAAGIDTTSQEYIPCFNDTPRTEWFTPFVCEAKERGWVKGFDGNYFKPTEGVTLSEALVILSKAFKWDVPDSSEVIVPVFDDTELNSWYIGYIAYAKDNLIIQELSSEISPHRLLSRKESAEYIYRTLLHDRGEKIEWKIWGNANDTWREMIATDIKPAIPPSYKFPSMSQAGYPYACYGFGVINLMEYKYKSEITPKALGENTGWDYSFIWEDPVFEAFGKYYDSDVIFGYDIGARYVYNKLAYGEPILLYRKYYIDGKNVGHQAAAFSFDDTGIYFGDSATGAVTLIPHEEVFNIQWFGKALNTSEIRLVKGDGAYKDQWGNL